MDATQAAPGAAAARLGGRAGQGPQSHGGGVAQVAMASPLAVAGAVPCSVTLTPPEGGEDAYPALQSALTTLPAVGGTLCLAAGTYHCSGTLDFTNRLAMSLRAEGYSRASNDTQTVNLVYTAAAGSLINADGTRGLDIAGLNLAYSHPSYMDTLIALHQVSGATNTAWIYLYDNRIGGLSTSSKAARSLIAMERAYAVTLERNTFLNAAVAIRGAQLSVINANGVSIRNNLFLQGFTDTHVKAGGQAWTVEGNIYEPITRAGEASAFDTTAVGVRGLRYRANWHGDASSGLWFSVTGGPILGGSISDGNQFQGIGTTEGVALGASHGVVVTGNVYATREGRRLA